MEMNCDLVHQRSEMYKLNINDISFLPLYTLKEKMERKK